MRLRAMGFMGGEDEASRHGKFTRLGTSRA
jgi:hypothetical protein